VPLQEYPIAPLRLMLYVAAVWVTVGFGVGLGLLGGGLAGDVGVTGAELPADGRVVLPLAARVAGGDAGRLLLAVDGDGPVVVDGVGVVVACRWFAARACR
jgi:hypothetical protein